ncbi:MAG TPA: PHB depolymerase family esterase [Clostridia bacterium]|nr:PHB depolymerase family esterase [Clostridia bacterium]
MIDNMNELTQFSPHAGKLFLQAVAGDISGRREAENNAVAGAGTQRSMFCYAPKSGCPDAKQCQVMMVLRDESGEASAQALLTSLELDKLAEEKHFLLLFPNPKANGWNYADDPARESDMDYLVRCFGILKDSEIGVSGFNGMIFYIAASESASALLMTMAALKPINVPAMMLSAFPTGYEIPAGALNIEVAAWSSNPAASEYIKWANCVEESSESVDGVITYYGKNPNVRLLTTERTLDADAVKIAWEQLFSETRRWQNDTYGTYQKRTNFTARGFVGHVNEEILGVNRGCKHTWYEYIPPQLRGTSEKVPLLFYFHGGGCVPLYGAEQSGWHDVADEENFIVVYPKAAQKKMWNVWNDPMLEYSDEAFFLALIDHMKTVHPIDETRIYVSGFSMGGMMSNCMACIQPNIVSAAAPCNAYNEGYFNSFATMLNRINNNNAMNMSDRFPGETEEITPVRKQADVKKTAYNYRMPIIQISGLLDQTWPITSPQDRRLMTFDYWKAYNNIHTEPFEQDNTHESGLKADETWYDGADERFLHHRWFSCDPGNPALYELFLAKRMPHALDIRTARYAWKFLKMFSRNPDGSLTITK